MAKKSIGQFIAALRKANGMTQKQLAEKLNVSDKAVSRWERDESAPDLSLIPVIAEIFGVTSDEILRGERRNQDNEDFTSQSNTKVEKQLEHLVNDTRTKFTIRSIIAAGIGFVGLLAAMICNFGFHRAGLGFLIGCVFYIAAIICEVLFFILSANSIKTSGFEGESINDCRKNLFRTAVRAFIIILFILVLSIPFIEEGIDYFGIPFDYWLLRNLIYSILFAVFCFIAVPVANHIAVNNGFFTLSEKEQSRNAEIFKLKKRSAITLMILLVVTFICHCIFDTPLYSAIWKAAAGGREFTNMAEFKEYIETPEDMINVTEDDLENSININPIDENVTMMHEDVEESMNNENIDDEINYDDYETEVIRATDGTVLCEYKHINYNVGGIDVKYEGDKVTVITYTVADTDRAYEVTSFINGCFVAAYFLEALGVIIAYNVKKKRIK